MFEEKIDPWRVAEPSQRVAEQGHTLPLKCQPGFGGLQDVDIVASTG